MAGAVVVSTQIRSLLERLAEADNDPGETLSVIHAIGSAIGSQSARQIRRYIGTQVANLGIRLGNEWVRQIDNYSQRQYDSATQVQRRERGMKRAAPEPPTFEHFCRSSIF